MLLPRNSSQEHLNAIADCHIKCFPSSLSSKLGKRYVIKTLEWFLVSTRRFLFHLEQDGIVVGFCGGFAPEKIGDGSSSGMLQYAFNEAVKGIMKKPWLVFHKEVRKQYPFILKNIKRKLFKTSAPMVRSTQTNFIPSVGLVVIGVHPSYRGKGYAGLLIKEFELRALQFSINRMVLSVKESNSSAIKAYQNSGWSIEKTENGSHIMSKQVAGK